MIKALIFDLWETLGTKNISVSERLRKKFGLKKTPEFLINYEKAIQLDEWENKEEMAENFLRRFNLDISQKNINFIISVINEAINKAELFKGMNELLKVLCQKYKLALLSNTTVFEAEVLKKWNLDYLFSTTVFSWQIHSLKPSKKNFKEIIEKLEVNPDECLFIDDSTKNVDSAKKYGMLAIKYRNLNQLKIELKQLGVIDSALNGF